MSEDQLNRLSRIFTFERKLREAQSVVELRYIVTNELRSIIPYLNAFFGSWANPNKFKIEAISDIAVVEKTLPHNINAKNNVSEVKRRQPRAPLFSGRCRVIKACKR